MNYREYDVNPYVKGQNRGAERIVIGDDGSVWYTNDHYSSFTKIQ
ncbi:ribonuclease domain-containing protein [Lacrimispora xylanolytica]